MQQSAVSFAPHISNKNYPIKEPYITQDKALDLFYQYKNTGEVSYKNAILVGNMRYITSLCCKKEFQYAQISVDDLIQEASIAFLKAIDGYNPERGTTIISYCRRNTEGAIRLFIKRTAHTIKVPENCHRAYGVMMQRYESAVKEHEHENIPMETLIDDKWDYEQAGAIFIHTRTFSDPASSPISDNRTEDDTLKEMSRILAANTKLPEPDRTVFRAFFNISEDKISNVQRRFKLSDESLCDMIFKSINQLCEEVEYDFGRRAPSLPPYGRMRPTTR